MRYGIGSDDYSNSLIIKIKTANESLFWEVVDGSETETFESLEDLLTHITSIY
jgi:hypothetical protein